MHFAASPHARSGLRTFTTTRRGRARSSARKTRDMPPPPNSRSKTYRSPSDSDSRRRSDASSSPADSRDQLATAGCGWSRNPGSASAAASSELTSRRSAASFAHASARKASRSLGARSSAECRTALTSRHRSGVISGWGTFAASSTPGIAVRDGSCERDVTRRCLRKGPRYRSAPTAKCRRNPTIGGVPPPVKQNGSLDETSRLRRAGASFEITAGPRGETIRRARSPGSRRAGAPAR